nr:alpha/beta fold hydrolase [Shouchella patagoniensis]
MKAIRLAFLSFILFTLVGSGFFTSEVHAYETSSIDFDKPVVLVHGIGGAGYNFNSIERKLRSVGYDRSDLHAIDFDDRSGNNLRNSRQLSEFIDDVLSQYDVDEVNIIAHSMGGSNTLRYLTQLNGVEKVDKVIRLEGLTV